MKPKKILVISDIPSHPQSAGNRARIYSFLSCLKRLGHEVHFVYENKEMARTEPEKPDIKAMKKAWDRVYTIPLNSYVIYHFFDKQIGRFGIFLKKTCPKIYEILKKSERKFKIKRPPSVDDLYNPALDRFVKKLSKRGEFDIVLAQYVFQSKALTHFDDRVLKIIDTHDALTNEEAIKSNEFFKGYIIYPREEEVKALNRADIIIAIQDKEKEFFSRLTKKKVVTIGHIIKPYKPIKRKSHRKNIFFIGFSHPTNKYGMDFFIKEAFPKIQSKYPGAKLIIAGKISNFAPNQKEIIKLGRVKNIEKAYSLADIVISPLFFGTGLKIKNIEALAHCKPLITTNFGAIGLEKAKNKAFLIANTSEQFIKQIERLFKSKKLYEKLSKKACNFIKQYNKENLEVLKRVFETKP